MTRAAGSRDRMLRWTTSGDPAKVWLLYLVLGTIGTAATAAGHEHWATRGSTAIQLTTGLAVIVGIFRFAPARAGFWWLLACGQLVYAMAQGYWRIAFDGWKPDIPFRSPDDVLYFIAFAFFITALGWRALAGVPGQKRRANALDGCIVVLGLSSGTWHFIAEPFLATRRLDAVDTSLFWAYEGVELLRMAFLFMIMLSGTIRGRAQWLLVAGVSTQLFGDLIYGVGMPSSGHPASGWQNGAWLLGSVMIGAAALHPDMAAAERQANDVDVISGRRLSVFVLLTLMGPMMTCIDAVLGEVVATSSNSSRSLDVWIPMILSVSVPALLVIRMGMLGSIAQRRATALDAALRVQEALRTELEHQASHDPLTGLGNRASFNRMLAEAIARPVGERGRLLLIDLDGFKQVNDTFGHPAGDELLVGLARDFQAAGRPGEVTRLGGDEFAVLLPPMAAEQARDTVRTMLTVAAQSRQLTAGSVRVSASIGVLDLDLASTPSDALHDVDVALYRAKAAGRNQVQAFRPADGSTKTAIVSRDYGHAVVR